MHGVNTSMLDDHSALTLMHAGVSVGDATGDCLYSNQILLHQGAIMMISQ
jgi:hypothetical protein